MRRPSRAFSRYEMFTVCFPAEPGPLVEPSLNTRDDRTSTTRDDRTPTTRDDRTSTTRDDRRSSRAFSRYEISR